MRTPIVLDQIAAAREAVRAAQSQGKKVGLVPTMGALHAGHLSLVDTAVRECDVTVATIFVNPTQFGPQEDFSRYPRTWEADLQALTERHVNYLFAPPTEVMYPPGSSTRVAPPRVAATLEGACRPGHFEGVCTIVLKLFSILPADFAYFGQKDYQQSRVIQAMVEDLNLPIAVRVLPTIREPDGLALSSRNRYLSTEERASALGLSQALAIAADRCAEGEEDAEAIMQAMQQVLRQAGVSQVDYAVLADPVTLEVIRTVRRPAAALVAAHVGETRLIDNRLIE